jgi:DnaK suppressor protein
MLKNKYLPELRALLIDRRNELVEYRQKNRAAWNKIEKNEKDYYDQAALENILAEMSHLDERRWHEILQIDMALERIEEGVYGICESCEESIGTARMKALPYARMCVHCAQSFERFGKSRFVNLPDLNKKASDCQDLIDDLREAIEEDGRVSSSDIEIKCSGDEMFLAFKLTGERARNVLQEIIDEISGTDEHAVEIRLENIASEEEGSYTGFGN